MFAEKEECPTPLYWIENTQVPEEYRINIRVVPDFKDIVNKNTQGVSKFLMVSKDPQQLFEVRSLLEKIDTVNVMCSTDDNIEVVNKNVGKGNALTFVSNMDEYNGYGIVAIGDSENDLSMLLESHYKIVMGNADESLKKIADFISPANDESGVAIAIEQVLKLI